MDTSQELNPIIEQLSRIDKLAADEAKKTEDKKEALLDDFDQKKAEYDASLKAEINARLDELKAKLDKEAEEKIAAVKDEYARRSKNLDECYEKNAQIWAEEIFNAVIGG